MTENNRFQIIHLGNPYDFVVKDHATNKTYGTLQGDDKSLTELLDELAEENKDLEEARSYYQENFLTMKTERHQFKHENKELKKRLSHAEKVNRGLIDENHRLRLTLIHSSDLNFDINWLKENLNDWNNKE